MRKYFLFIASSVLFGSQLVADPIQDLTITSLTASWGPDGGPISFSGSGPSVTIGGWSQGLSSPPFPYAEGAPIGAFSFNLSPTNFFTVLARGGTVDGAPVGLQRPGPVVSGSTNLPAPVNGTVSFAATVAGTYTAFACGPSEAPPNCTGSQGANIAVNLPGVLTLDFGGPPTGTTFLLGATFTTTPEPSAMLATLLGGVAIAGCCFSRRRFHVPSKTLS
jgi:hypothetical protein